MFDTSMREGRDPGTLRILGITLLIAIIATFTAGTATASGVTLGNSDTATIEFGYTEGDSFEAIYASIVRSNGADLAAKFFGERSTMDESTSDIPGLSGFSEEERVAVLSNSAAAATAGDTSFGGPDGMTATGEVSPMSFSTAPVRGGAINNNRSWQLKARYNWTGLQSDLLDRVLARLYVYDGPR